MGPLSLFTEDEPPEALALAILEYCEEFLFPLATEGTVEVLARRSGSRGFNARAIARGDGRFAIVLQDGVVTSLVETVERLEIETLADDLDLIGSTLFRSSGSREMAHRGLVIGSIFFVLLHEVSHITCGHLGYAMHQRSSSMAAASFDEIPAAPEPLEAESRRPDGPAIELSRWDELEADVIGFNLLDGLSFELLLADTVLRDASLHPYGFEPPALARRRASELMFYSACLAIGMIEARRGPTDIYPLPFSRILLVGDMYAQMLMPDLREARIRRPGVLEVHLTEELRETLHKIVLPVVFNAIELCEAACGHFGFELAERFGWGREDFATPRHLTEDFSMLLRDAGNEESLHTREARELAELREMRVMYEERLAPFRLPLSYRG